MHDTSVTGIPIEYLFLIIGSLVMLVYADMKRELKGLRKSSETRGQQLVRIKTILRIVCHRLQIPFGDDDSDDDHD